MFTYNFIRRRVHYFFCILRQHSVRLAGIGTQEQDQRFLVYSDTRNVVEKFSSCASTKKCHDCNNEIHAAGLPAGETQSRPRRQVSKLISFPL